MQGETTNKKSIYLPFTLLVVFVVAMAIVYWMAFTKENNDAQYLSLVVEQRVLSQGLAKSATLAATGNEVAFATLRKYQKEFARNMNQLSGLDPLTDENTLPESVRSVYDTLKKSWKDYNKHINTLLQSQETILILSEDIKAINEQMPDMLNASNEVAEILVDSDVPTRQVYLATQQLMFIERISGNISVMMSGSSDAAQSAQRFGLDTATFKRVLDSLINGNKMLGIGRVEDPDASELLDEISKLYNGIKTKVADILERSPETFEINNSAMSLYNNSENLLQQIGSLGDIYQESVADDTTLSLTGNALAGAIVILFFLIGALLIAQEKRVARETEEQRNEVEAQNNKNEAAIMRLLDEMGALADGDLTAHATVTEDITGAIADSINYTIDALRSLVTQINDTTVQVSSAAHETQATAMHLAEASDQQAAQITTASTAVNHMAASIEEVSSNANDLANEASNSVEIANKGSMVVQDAISGMDTIREQIQETSKRIKRLGESSQEIGDIVEIINDISEQTNILALNAAIQAAMAGDAGRGFAVVADEVQRLAERSGNATKQIEALVKTIQADTNEAVISMERSTSEVVQGARLAQNAGGALEEIEQVSATLAKLIQAISDTTKQQSSAAVSISGSMNVVQEITTQTSAGTNETAASIGNLAELANELRQSVAGFTLPD
ncbi:MAG: type IV pili methyl-accepting chemotaxis transducer N-terminal domain-containing protein [Gammaproteobacteria bacterium]|nr:type IV pili methyl-accepting chemotaxis transducer N-terminal domain-containing protein [Gammaproteobacteria bacterium]